MEVVKKATLFTEITVEESATVSGGTVTIDVGSALGNQLASNAVVYYQAVVAANSSSSNIVTLTTTPTDLLPVLRLNSAGVVGIKSN